ncbi:MAG: hypothetical protein ACI8P3_000022 [Saprospiraceae bacterium]|jgi:hypothetical protein
MAIARLSYYKVQVSGIKLKFKLDPSSFKFSGFDPDSWAWAWAWA